MQLKELNATTFYQYTQTATGVSFMQSPEMGSLLTDLASTAAYVAYEVEGDIKVAALLFERYMAGGKRLELHSGPVVSDPTYLSDFYRALKVYAKKEKALELVVRPSDNYQTFDSHGQPTSPEQPELIQTLTQLGYQHDGLQTGYPDGEPTWHYLKSLSGLTVDNLSASFDKKGKALLKKANTFGVRIRKLGRNELETFKNITRSTSQRRDYRDRHLSYYYALYDNFGDRAEFMLATLNFKQYYENLSRQQEGVRVKIEHLQQEQAKRETVKRANQIRELSEQYETFTVRKEEAQTFIYYYGETEIPLAASLFLYMPQEAVYLFSGSYTEFNKFYAPALLQEYAMKQAIQRGIPLYNLLGISGLFDGQDGVLGFKQNFNGYIVRKMGAFRYHPYPLRFKLITTIKRLLRR